MSNSKQTTVEAIAHAAQGVVNALADSAGQEALIVGGMAEMGITGQVNGKPTLWPLEDDSYYILVSVPVGAGETIRAAGILAGITPITGEGVMA